MHLDRLTAKALHSQEEVLDAVYTGDPDTDKQLRRDKVAVSAAVVTQALRADETRLRARQVDQLPNIIAEIARLEGAGGASSTGQARGAMAHDGGGVMLDIIPNSQKI
jgi:hypothetical protein